MTNSITCKSESENLCNSLLVNQDLYQFQSGFILDNSLLFSSENFSLLSCPSYIDDLSPYDSQLSLLGRKSIFDFTNFDIIGHCIVGSLYFKMISSIDNEDLKEVSPKTLSTIHSFFSYLEYIFYLEDLSFDNLFSDSFLNVDFDGELVFEWWNNNKKIVFYILDDSIEFIKVWGPDTEHQMEDGLMNSFNMLSPLCNWLGS